MSDISNSELKFGSQEVSEIFNQFLLTQTIILKSVLDTKLIKKAKEIVIILASACNTSTAIIELGKKTDYFYNETVMLSRAFIEKIINFCYLMICDSDEYEKFILHALYKSYQNLDRERFTSNKKVSILFNGKSQIDLNDNPKLKRALELFPKKRMNWTKKDINKRINLIDERTNLNIGIFLLNTLSIYTDASEALHGSLYGCSFHTFAYDPKIDHSNKKEVNINLQKNISLIYLQLGSMIHETITLLNQFNDINKFFDSSNKNNKDAIELLEKVMSNV